MIPLNNMSSLITRKHIGLVAAVTPIWFVLVYSIMSSLRPDYSHLHRAISELGALDAPYHWYWNIFGYVLPGLAIAALGIALKAEFGSHSAIPSYALVLSGLFMTLSGVFPADMQHRDSLTTTLHLVGAFGSYVAFLVASIGYPAIFWPSSAWRSLAWVTLILAIASIALGFLRHGSVPGLGQRITFVCYFLWISLVAYRLYRKSAQSRLNES